MKKWISRVSIFMSGCVTGILLLLLVTGFFKPSSSVDWAWDTTFISIGVINQTSEEVVDLIERTAQYSGSAKLSINMPQSLGSAKPLTLKLAHVSVKDALELVAKVTDQKVLFEEKNANFVPNEKQTANQGMDLTR